MDEERKKQLRDYQRVYMREYRKRNYEKVAAGWRKHHSENKEKWLAAARAYKKRKRAEMTAIQRKRHCGQLLRTPKWADTEWIKRIYRICAEITKATGVKHEVDHEIPLQGEYVSGLHVPDNLRITTKTENLKKGNKWQPR